MAEPDSSSGVDKQGNTKERRTQRKEENRKVEKKDSHVTTNLQEVITTAKKIYRCRSNQHFF